MNEMLRQAVRHLAQIENAQSHGSHRDDHAPADCSYCRAWVIAVLEVWTAADNIYGPPTVAHQVLQELKGGR